MSAPCTADYFTAQRTQLSIPAFTSDQMLLLLAGRVLAQAASDGVHLQLDEALGELESRRSQAINELVEQELAGL